MPCFSFFFYLIQIEHIASAIKARNKRQLLSLVSFVLIIELPCLPALIISNPSCSFRVGYAGGSSLPAPSIKTSMIAKVEKQKGQPQLINDLGASMARFTVIIRDRAEANPMSTTAQHWIVASNLERKK